MVPPRKSEMLLVSPTLSLVTIFDGDWYTVVLLGRTVVSATPTIHTQDRCGFTDSSHKIRFYINSLGELFFFRFEIDPVSLILLTHIQLLCHRENNFTFKAK